jgi:hypothetical protein
MLKTLGEDLRRRGLTQSIRRDYREAKEYMLTEQRRKLLDEMPVWKRWIVTWWWMLKAMFFKLAPVRRLLLVAGIVFLLISRTSVNLDSNVRVQADTGFAGIFCILLVLLLELKDKLVATEELEAGRAVQHAMMPERSPAFPGWELWLYTRPANEVGGDLVDFVRVNGNRCGVVLGDVAGKGLRAALLMVKLQATLRAIAPDFSLLSELSSKLNQIFCRDSIRSIFASMVYVELRTEASTIRLVNAGHLPPVVVKNGSVQPLPKGGAALGITPDATFSVQELQLDDHDFLCAFSDGVTEAQNEYGAFFGEQRVFETLGRHAGQSLGSIGDQLVAEVDAFVGQAPTHDDLTIALIRRSPGATAR